MKEQTIINIIVTGTGGQGVITLSKWIRELAINHGFDCEGATFKGGAQRMGTVYSELRIRSKQENRTVFSSQIPKGKVDVLIGMEPWEALRFANMCNANSKAIINTREEKLYVERLGNNINIDPVSKLKELFDEIVIKDYATVSKSETEKKTNQLMLQDAIAHGYLPFSSEEFENLIESKHLIK